MVMLIDGYIRVSQTSAKAKQEAAAAKAKSWENAYAAGNEVALGRSMRETKPSVPPAAAAVEKAVTTSTLSGTTPSTASAPMTAPSSNANRDFYNRLPEEDRQAMKEGTVKSLNVEIEKIDRDLGALGANNMGYVAEGLMAQRARAEADLAAWGVKPPAAEPTAAPVTPMEERPPIPIYENFLADKEAGKDVPQFSPPRVDGDRTIFIHWPDAGGYVRNEYVWDEGNQRWLDAAVEYGGPGGGTIQREDLLDPDSSFSNPIEREDSRPAHVIMRDDHYDRDGSKQNSYPNTITPDYFPDGPIEPTYENYPVEPDPVIGAVSSFLGFPFFSPVNPEGYSDPVATAAGTGSTIAGGVPNVGTGLTIVAGEALGLANEHRGGPTLDGPARERMQRGLPLPR